VRRNGSLPPAAGTIALTACAVLLGFAAAGCGTKNNTGASASGAQLDIGNTINYGSLGTTTTLDCGDGKSLNVGGNNNTLTVKGTCETVSVGGADNKITIDKIDKHLNIVGIDNTITYKDGNPEVENHSNGNTITKAR
jgi:Protein of unknown function (DUF3060)